MPTNIYIFCFFLNFGCLLGCIPTESPDDRPHIPGVFPTSTRTPSGPTVATVTTTPATTSTSTPTTTTTSTTTTSTTTTTTTSTTTTTTHFCEPDWVLFTVPTGETYCYYLSLTRGTYAQSQADCELKGANLASVHSREENDFIFNQLIVPAMYADRTDLYTGQTRIGGMSPMCTEGDGTEFANTGGPFVYEDGTNFDWSNWCPDEHVAGSWVPKEPNCFDGLEQCVQIQTANTQYPTCDNRWDNIGCTRNTRYVCKAPAPFSG